MNEERIQVSRKKQDLF